MAPANANATSPASAGPSSHEMSPKGASDGMSANSDIHRASDHTNAKKLGELKGKKVMGSDGEKLGDLHDFVLDAKSGKIAHALVSTGGLLGMGDKLRVVAHDSFKHDADGLGVQMDKSAFEALPTVEEKDASGNFILASELDGKELRAGDEEIGTIKDVAIDIEQGTAMAVVKVKSDTAGGDDLFHVAFSSLQIDSAHSQSVSTTLARTDFTQTTSMTQPSATSPSEGSTSDESLTPTGRTSTRTAASESYGSTASASSSKTMPAEDDAASTDAAARGTSGNRTSSGSTYGSATSSHSTPAVSPGNDPAAVASETTEPYGAKADSSLSSTADTGISGNVDTTSRGSSGSAAASTPSGPMTPTRPGYSSPGSSARVRIPSAETNTSADSRSGAHVSDSADTSSSSRAAGPGTTETPTTEDEQLTPTGRDHGSDLTSAAAAIRSALNSDQTLASEDVKVQEAGKKIMLQGKVSSEDTKERIETLAKQAAGSAEIDSKLKVKNQE